MSKYVYFFGGGNAEGDTTMRNLLGGKGANLCEMAKLGFPVPPATTDSDPLPSNFTFHSPELVVFSY